jgi:hypothetical protein
VRRPFTLQSASRSITSGEADAQQPPGWQQRCVIKIEISSQPGCMLTAAGAATAGARGCQLGLVCSAYMQAARTDSVLRLLLSVPRRSSISCRAAVPPNH